MRSVNKKFNMCKNNEIRLKEKNKICKKIEMKMKEKVDRTMKMEEKVETTMDNSEKVNMFSSFKIFCNLCRIEFAQFKLKAI